MAPLETMGTSYSVGDLLPWKVQFSTVKPLAAVPPLVFWATAQKPVVPVNVQSLMVTLLASTITIAPPKLMPLRTAPFWVTTTSFLDG